MIFRRRMNSRRKMPDEAFKRGLEAYIDDHYTNDIADGFPLLEAEYSAPAEMFSVREEAAAYKEMEPAPPLMSRPKGAAQMGIGAAPKPRKFSRKESLDDLMAHVEDTFQQRLMQLIDRSGMKDSTVYKRAGLDRKLFSKIRSNAEYTPKKKTVLALAAALELSVDDAQDLLKRAGYAFSPSSKTDIIVTYCLMNEVYELDIINNLLYEYGQPVLN